MNCYGKSGSLIALTIKFSINYRKLATLAMKGYVGKSKINSSKKLPLVGIEPGTLELWDLLCYTIMASSLS